MKSILKADDFYVKMKTSSYKKEDTDFWSVSGLRFISELVSEAIEKAGIEPAKVCIRIGSGSYGVANDDVSIAYPSPRTVIVSHIKISNGNLCLARRHGERLDKGGDDWYSTDRIPLADPKLIDKLAEIITVSLPKKSKFAQQ